MPKIKDFHWCATVHRQRSKWVQITIDFLNLYIVDEEGKRQPYMDNLGNEIKDKDGKTIDYVMRHVIIEKLKEIPLEYSQLSKAGIRQVMPKVSPVKGFRQKKQVNYDEWITFDSNAGVWRGITGFDRLRVG